MVCILLFGQPITLLAMGLIKYLLSNKTPKLIISIFSPDTIPEPPHTGQIVFSGKGLGPVELYMLDDI
jgi:hypothetical protein